MTSLYDPYPKTKIEGHQGELIQGWESILAQLQEKMEDILVIDTYPGVYDEEIKQELKRSPTMYGSTRSSCSKIKKRSMNN